MVDDNCIHGGQNRSASQHNPSTIMHPGGIHHSTMTTAGLIRHMPCKMLVGMHEVTVYAPVKLAIADPANGVQAPALRGKYLVFALPGGKELEVASWL